jgi:uridine phosphorylase
MDHRAQYGYDARAHDWDYTLAWKRENIGNGDSEAAMPAKMTRVMRLQMTAAVAAIRNRIDKLHR